MVVSKVMESSSCRSVQIVQNIHYAIIKPFAALDFRYKMMSIEYKKAGIHTSAILL